MVSRVGFEIVGREAAQLQAFGGEGQGNQMQELILIVGWDHIGLFTDRAEHFCEEYRSHNIAVAWRFQTAKTLFIAGVSNDEQGLINQWTGSLAYLIAMASRMV